MKLVPFYQKGSFPLLLAEGMRGYLWCLSGYQSPCRPLSSLSITSACYTFQSPCWHPKLSQPLSLLPCPPQLTGFPPHRHLSFLYPGYSHYSLCYTLSLSSSCYPLTLSPSLILTSSLYFTILFLVNGCYSPSLADSPGHAQSAGCVQSTSGLLQVALSVLSSPSTTRPLTISWSSRSCQQFLY